MERPEVPGHRLVPANPLLSSAVTGVSLQDFTHHAVVLPVVLSDSQNNNAQSDSNKTKDTNSNTVAPISTNPGEKAAKAAEAKSAKPKDDFDVSEYFARLQGTRYVSAPLNIAKEEKEAMAESEENLEEINLLEDTAEAEQSLTSDIAQNFSQLPQRLPQVASAVFNSFSNILNRNRFKEAGESDNDGQGCGVANAARSDGGSSGSFVGAGASCAGGVERIEVPMFSPDVEYKEEKTPAGPPPIGGSANTYRMASKKKTYAHIPGLSTSGFQAPKTVQSAPQSLANQPLMPPMPHSHIPETVAHSAPQMAQRYPPFATNYSPQYNVDAGFGNATVASSVGVDASAISSNLTEKQLGDVAINKSEPAFIDQSFGASVKLFNPVVMETRENPPSSVESNTQSYIQNASVQTPSQGSSITPSPFQNAGNYTASSSHVDQISFSNNQTPSFPLSSPDMLAQSSFKPNENATNPPPTNLPPTGPFPSSAPISRSILPPSVARRLSNTQPRKTSIPETNYFIPSLPPNEAGLEKSEISLHPTLASDFKAEGSIDFFSPPAAAQAPPSLQPQYAQESAHALQSLPAYNVDGTIKISSSQLSDQTPKSSSEHPNQVYEPPKTQIQPTVPFHQPSQSTETPKIPPEPPKVAAVQSFRLGSKRPQYYSGPIEGTGPIASAVKPTLDPVYPTAQVGNVALFTPASDLSTSEIDQPASYFAHNPDVTNQTPQIASQESFDVFDLSRPSVEHNMYPEHYGPSRLEPNRQLQEEASKDESTGIRLLGSLKSKLSSVNINNLQNVVTTFFDPAYYDASKETSGDIPPQSEGDATKYGMHQQSQQAFNIEISVPSYEYNAQNQQNYGVSYDQNYQQPYINQYNNSFDGQYQQSFDYGHNTQSYNQQSPVQPQPQAYDADSSSFVHGYESQNVTQKFESSVEGNYIPGNTKGSESQDAFKNFHINVNNNSNEVTIQSQHFAMMTQEPPQSLEKANAVNQAHEINDGIRMFDLNLYQDSNKIENPLQNEDLAGRRTHQVHNEQLVDDSGILSNTGVHSGISGDIDFCPSLLVSKEESAAQAIAVAEENVIEPDTEYEENDENTLISEDSNTNDITTQMIANMTSPVQLINPVHVPLTEANSEIPFDVEENNDQMNVISQITEETIETMQIQASNEFFDRDDERDNVLNNEANVFFDEAYAKFNWLLKPEDQALKEQQELLDFYCDSKDNKESVSRSSSVNLHTNASDEIKAGLQSVNSVDKQLFGKNISQQMTVTPAPLARDISPTVQHLDIREESLDVNLIEQDAKNDFAELLGLNENDQETDDCKLERERSDDTLSLEREISRALGNIMLKDDSSAIDEMKDASYNESLVQENKKVSSPIYENVHNILGPIGDNLHKPASPIYENVNVLRNTTYSNAQKDRKPSPIYENVQIYKQAVSPTFSFSSYYDTGNYAADNYYRKTQPHNTSEIGKDSCILKSKVSMENVNSVEENTGSDCEIKSKISFDAAKEASVEKEKSLNKDEMVSNYVHQSFFSQPETSHNVTATADKTELLDTSFENKILPPQSQDSTIPSKQEILPDPLNFFSSQSVQSEPKSEPSFNLLASYFAAPQDQAQKPDPKRSFFELSQGQDHYMHPAQSYHVGYCEIEYNSPFRINNLADSINNIRSNCDNAEIGCEFKNSHLQTDEQKSLRNNLNQNNEDIPQVQLINNTTVNTNSGPNNTSTNAKSEDFENEFTSDINLGEIEQTFSDYESRLAGIINECEKCRQNINEAFKFTDKVKSFDSQCIGDKNTSIEEPVDSDESKKGKGREMQSSSKHGGSERGNQGVKFNDIIEEKSDDSNREEDGDSSLEEINTSRALHHWFYCSEKEDKLVWKPFSMIDSLSLEAANNSSSLGEETLVATDGGRFDVHLVTRTRRAVYWVEKISEVRRCSWFYKGTLDVKYVPYTEEVADILETEYRRCSETGEWHKRIPLPGGESVVLHGPTMMVHFLEEPSDPWGNAQQAVLRPRVVRRGTDSRDVDTERPGPIDHLILLCHGIGSACDLRFRPVEQVVDDFRTSCQHLIQSHYKKSFEAGKVGRVEVLPISWHSSLHCGAAGVDERLAAITLDTIPRLRGFVNDTVMDVLLYTSPLYCQTIMDTVGSELERIHALFTQRNPQFRGGVSLGGHSLGSVILFDLLSHQRVGAESSALDKVRYVPGAAGSGQPCVRYPQLSFHPRALYALGSPIAIFECIRGIDSLGEDFRLPTCPAFFNIFHPYDPIAYRIEPLINPEFKNVPPLLIPHHKGRKRMHLELKETMARVGADIKQRVVDTWLKNFGGMWRPSDKQEAQTPESNAEPEVESSDDAHSTATSELEPAGPSARSGQLNGGRRVDYVLQEAPLELINEYLSAVTSHVCYWESSDTMLLILREVYSELSVSPDVCVPQQSMSVAVDDSSAASGSKS